MTYDIIVKLAAITFAYGVFTLFVVMNLDPYGLSGRWESVIDRGIEIVAKYVPPILWPVTWPVFAVAYMLIPPLALLSSRLFVPQVFRK